MSSIKYYKITGESGVGKTTQDKTQWLPEWVEISSDEYNSTVESMQAETEAQKTEWANKLKADRQSAINKLKSLGLTEDEAFALVK